VSLKEISKEMEIAGKGQNETLEIVNPLRRTKIAKNDTRGHVPENGGT
jgi:hypothetical protein